MSVLSDSARIAWLRLARANTVGPVTFWALIKKFGSAAAALEELPSLPQRGGEALRLPSVDDARAELNALADMGGRMIAACEDDYPAGLAAMEAPPPLICVLGRAELLKKDMIAIVGARNASALGRKFAGTLARDLNEAGLVVVSGLARGIDTAAHEASLDGGTIAVIAGGVDNIYPPENAPLYERIRKQGVIVSEMPLGQSPQARHFPRRNRIISGLSRGVVVVEAAEGSGSLITANYALEQNREVFAVPGSPLDPRARGANRLLREGATLIESAEDVLAVLRPMLAGPTKPDLLPVPEAPATPKLEPDRVRSQIEEILGPAPVEIDELVRLSRLPAEAVRTVLLELELEQKIVRHPGNRVSWS
jgi:DNA processing protein